MVDYQEDQLFPFPRDRVWQLLRAHMDDTTISRIHPLIQSQKTVSTSGDATVLDRRIDARGKVLASTWRVTNRPPDYTKWEVIASNGPYAVGSWLENTYSQEAAGTRIRTHGDLRISVLPFFLPQRRFIRGVLDTIDAEDQNFLRT
jgi:hypothetical protein